MKAYCAKHYSEYFNSFNAKLVSCRCFTLFNIKTEIQINLSNLPTYIKEYILIDFIPRLQSGSTLQNLSNYQTKGKEKKI